LFGLVCGTWGAVVLMLREEAEEKNSQGPEYRGSIAVRIA